MHYVTIKDRWSDNVHVFTVIHAKIKHSSPQGEKDRVLLLQRNQKCRNMFCNVKENIQRILNNPKRSKLLAFANILANKIQKPLDRLAKRVSDATYCWFCENWASILPHIPEAIVELNKSLDKNSNIESTSPQETIQKELEMKKPGTTQKQPLIIHCLPIKQQTTKHYIPLNPEDLLVKV